MAHTQTHAYDISQFATTATPHAAEPPGAPLDIACPEMIKTKLNVISLSRCERHSVTYEASLDVKHALLQQ